MAREGGSGGGLWLGALLAGAVLYGAMIASAERQRLRPVRIVAQAWRRAFARRNRSAEWLPVPHPHHRRAPKPGEHGPVADARPTEPPETARSRGRGARYPWQIPARGWRHILVRTASESAQDHLGLISAGVAFYALLSIFPALVVAVALVGLVSKPTDFIGQLSEISQVLPADVASLIVTQAAEIAGRSSGGLGLAAVLGLVIALYSSSRAVISLIEGLNVAYDEDEKRGLIRLNLESLVLTLVLLVGGLFGVMATVVIPPLLYRFGMEAGWLGWFGTLRWPILVGGTMLGLTILYRFGPSRRAARWQWLSVGAVLASLLLLAGTLGFAWYAAHLARYNQTFGALGGVVMLLMWLWLSTYIVLIGAELNAEIEAQTAQDTTVGRDRPMGLRGAAKADTLGGPAD